VLSCCCKISWERVFAGVGVEMLLQLGLLSSGKQSTCDNLAAWLARKKRKRRSQLSPCFCVTFPVCFSCSGVYCKLFPIAPHFIPISFSCMKVLFLELFVTICLGLPWVNQHLHWYHGKNFKVHFKLLVKCYKYSMLRLN
jgi:hypothetical protein